MEVEYKAVLKNSEGRILRPTGQVVDFASRLGYSEKGIDVRIKYDEGEADLLSAMQVSCFIGFDGKEVRIVVSGGEGAERAELEKIGRCTQGLLEMDLKDYELVRAYKQQIAEREGIKLE